MKRPVSPSALRIGSQCSDSNGGTTTIPEPTMPLGSLPKRIKKTRSPVWIRLVLPQLQVIATEPRSLKVSRSSESSSQAHRVGFQVRRYMAVGGHVYFS